MAEPISFVKACQDFFSKDPHGRKIEVAEFKALSYEDRLEIRKMLIELGYDVAELSVPPPQE
jgi:hypothetical protein